MYTEHGRRAFVKAVAVAIATSKRPILGANDRVRVGIVGLGGRGTDHIESYSKLERECRIEAVCDVNQQARERAVARVRRLNNYDPKEYVDMRGLFESKDIDAVSLPLPNHWHALATIWACQAGKDVYVEKPATHNLFEAQQVVAAARKYKRMVQVGSQSRSIPYMIRAMQLLREGAVGEVVHARGLCFRRRFSIGHTPDAPVPAGLNWDMFLGPAQWKPYSVNKFAYNWHWFWDTGNGDIGNQGVHEMDKCLWGLDRGGWPASVASLGNRYAWKDDGETPNTQQTTFDMGNSQITFDVRNLPTPPEGLVAMNGPNFVGNIFFGTQGFLVVHDGGFDVYKSSAKVSADETRNSDSAKFEKYERTVSEKAGDEPDTVLHMKNFLDAVRSRDHRSLNAEIAIGARAAAFCHLANISYRTGRALKVSQATGRFLGDDAANALATRDYREPYVVPEQV